MTWIERNRWFTIAPSIFVFWLVGLLDKFAVGTILTDKKFLADVHLTGHYVLIGLLASTVAFMQAAGNFVFGWAVDRFGPRRCAVIGSAGWAVSSAAAAVAPGLAVLLLSRIILGLSEGYTWPVGNALTARWFQPHERSRARAIWVAAGCVGPGVAGFMTGTLLDSFSWRGVFWCLAGLSLLICLPVALLFVKDGPARGRQATTLRAESGTEELDQVTTVRPRGGFKRSSFWLTVAAASGTSVAVWALATWLPSYLADERHLARGAINQYLLYAYGCGLVLMIVFSHVIDRTQRRGIWGAAAFAMAAVLLLITALAPSAPYAVLLALMITVVYGITILVTQGFMDATTPPHRMGRENGAMNGITNIVAGTVPLLMGVLIGAASGSYVLALTLLAFIFAAAMVSCLAMARKGY